jgi:predicted MFS family arabinose efflux permease
MASVAAAALAGLVSLGAFFAWEARAAQPMMPLGMFRNRDFAGANLLTLLLYAALGGALYFVPLDLIQVRGWSATRAGAALLPFVAIMFALSRFAGALVDRVGARLPLVLGPTVAAAGFALFALTAADDDYWTSFHPAIAVLGLGMTLTIAPLTTTVMNALGDAVAGTASGVNNAVSRAAGLLAIAAFGAVLAQVFEARLPDVLNLSTLPRDAARHVLAQQRNLGAIAAPAGAAAAVAAEVHRVVADVFVAGFRAVMWIAAALALGSAGCAAWLISGAKPAPTRKAARP